MKRRVKETGKKRRGGEGEGKGIIESLIREWNTHVLSGSSQKKKVAFKNPTTLSEINEVWASDWYSQDLLGVASCSVYTADHKN